MLHTVKTTASTSSLFGRGRHALAAQHGLEGSLAAYQQMDAVPLPPQGATALNASNLARVKDFYVQARSLELPYEALATNSKAVWRISTKHK